jgi:hypothetical protein
LQADYRAGRLSAEAEERYERLVYDLARLDGARVTKALPKEALYVTFA